MIRNAENTEGITASISFMDGTGVSKADIPSDLLTYDGRFVSYWEKDELVIIPMAEVKGIRLHFS